MRSSSCTRPACSIGGSRRSRCRPSASSRAPAAGAPICAGRCSGAARSAGRARRTSRSGGRAPRQRGSWRHSAHGREPSSVCSTAAGTRSPMKGAEPIAQILAAAGAGGTVLGLEEQGVLGATRGQANRLANADHANLVRTARAAHVQLLAARFLRDTGRLEGLPAPLREIAVLRLDHPALPLVELALRCDPPTTKATAHRRLRTLVRLLDEGRAGGGAPRTSSPSG